MEFGIGKCAMLIMKSGKRQINRTTQPRKNQNTWRKGKLQVLGNMKIGHNYTSGVRKKKKRVPQKKEKASRKQVLRQKSH